jgi:hypothetical protein
MFRPVSLHPERSYTPPVGDNFPLDHRYFSEAWIQGRLRRPPRPSNPLPQCFDDYLELPVDQFDSVPIRRRTISTGSSGGFSPIPGRQGVSFDSHSFVSDSGYGVSTSDGESLSSSIPASPSPQSPGPGGDGSVFFDGFSFDRSPLEHPSAVDFYIPNSPDVSPRRQFPAFGFSRCVSEEGTSRFKETYQFALPPNFPSSENGSKSLSYSPHFNIRPVPTAVSSIYSSRSSYRESSQMVRSSPTKTSPEPRPSTGRSTTPVLPRPASSTSGSRPAGMGGTPCFAVMF